ncbi:hypothetical protein HOF92_01710 [bacterium]|jgi:nitrate reductase assembly molybdenum cofactor insertion protein NarJ|nr:hypothetical protein [bacterium]
MDLTHYNLLASLFDYPREDYTQMIAKTRDYMLKNYPEAGDELSAFYDELPTHALRQMQELFTKSFDVQSITALDVGYVMFGEDYKRGELLSHMNKEQVECGNDCHSELADHLPNVLRLMALLGENPEKQETLDELVQIILAPVVNKMIAEFAPERLEKKKEAYQKHYKTLIESPREGALAYSHALKGLSLVLTEDFDLNNIENLQSIPDKSVDFLKSITQELEIEGDNNAHA